MKARAKIITLLAALCIWAGWLANPNPGSAQGYCYQTPPVQVYNYPTYYGYSQPVAAPGGYCAAYPAPRPYKHKKWRKHKHKHKHQHWQQYY